MSLIELSHVSKDYKVTMTRPGAGNVLRNLFRPDTKIVHAVTDVSLTVEAGELVGFIGENGAGKSTTLELLSGILFPTSGHILVSGLCPYRRRERNAHNIGVVFGQRSRLNWDLPMADSFELYKEIYRIDSGAYRRNVDRFVEMLHMQAFYDTPVRQLSLGQRMKAEVALALLHEPPILYLDEPTIGLDVMAKQQIREFIVERNRQEGTTTILTSHDMKDLAYICRRIVVLAKGTVLFDGSMEEFRRTYAREEGMDMEDMVRDIYEEVEI
nr:ATP-binding cassette domain-containing protein [uncultured Acetatifactor sp.]